MSDQLLEELLSKPVGPAVPGRNGEPTDFTRKIEFNGNTLTAEISDKAGSVNQGRALRYIEEEGQDPDEWEVGSWYKVEYGPLDPVLDADGEQVIHGGEPLTRSRMESVKFTFRRRTANPLVRPVYDIDEILEGLKVYEPVVDVRPDGQHGFLVLIGDMQFGKIDGDGPAGTIARTMRAIDEAALRLDRYSLLFDIGHVHIAWLGDHIEGFVSQGGANVWRTQLTLNEQIRLTRRVMQHALLTFAPLAAKVTMAAVPGNHGETVRFEGTGVTRYDDSHDTEALIAVADAAGMSTGFEHVEFMVPDTDELIVMTNVAGTIIAHHHGHKWRPGKHFDWWEEQAFNRDSAMHVADLLVAGHLHHEHFETNGTRDYWGVNALESESTWFRHSRGIGGSPGVHVGITKDGQTNIRESIKMYGGE